MKISTVLILLIAVGAALYFLTRPVPKPVTPLDVAGKIVGGSIDVVEKIGEEVSDSTAYGVVKGIAVDGYGIVKYASKTGWKAVDKTYSAITYVPKKAIHYLNPNNW